MNNKEKDPLNWDFMSEDTFAKLGKSTLVYIREDTDAAGHKIFTTHAADGVLMSCADNHDEAFRLALNEELIPLTVH
jgi:hypothetical protein